MLDFCLNVFCLQLVTKNLCQSQCNGEKVQYVLEVVCFLENSQGIKLANIQTNIHLKYYKTSILQH